jgi:putative membrane protein
MMNGYYGSMGWGGWVLMSLVMVAFWALVVYAIVVLFRGSGAGSRPGAEPPADPRRILDERYARGEIQLDEYQARKEALAGAERAPKTL